MNILTNELTDFLELEFQDCHQNLMKLLESLMPVHEVELEEFAKLLKFLEALPLTTDLFSFSKQWISSSKTLSQKGERSAARYQLKMVGRRLALFSFQNRNEPSKFNLQDNVRVHSKRLKTLVKSGALTGDSGRSLAAAGFQE